MKTLIRISYSTFFYPLVVLGFHILALFRNEIRQALMGRYRVQKMVRNYRSLHKKSGSTILLHTASMGEFEHVKPLIDQLHEKFNAEIVVTFFSPSGYDNVKAYPGVQLFLYMPLDFSFSWRAMFKKLEPDAILISKHDVWPNQVWCAAEQKIPIFLVNASLAENSSRTRSGIRYVQSLIYRELTAIFTISEEDEKRFARYFPNCQAKMVGDTKYDQVLQRKQKAVNHHILPATWLEGKETILLGSVWPEDTAQLVPALKKILPERPELRAIIVPHQPEPKYVQTLTANFSRFGVCRFSELTNIKNEMVLIVDKIGVLADLYKYAQIAYVGGSFRQGIHNVMEPAIYDIPILYGPVHTNSYEAIRLLEARGSIQLTDELQAESVFLELLNNEARRRELGNAAGRFARKHTGGTVRIVSELQNMEPGLKSS